MPFWASLILSDVCEFGNTIMLKIIDAKKKNPTLDISSQLEFWDKANKFQSVFYACVTDREAAIHHYELEKINRQKLGQYCEYLESQIKEKDLEIEKLKNLINNLT